MNVLREGLRIGSLAICFGISALGQQQFLSIHGPILGFVEDQAGEVIRPMLGIPGASVLGPPLVLDTAIRSAVISPTQDYALAVRSEDEAAVVIRLDQDPVHVHLLDGIRPGVDVVAISPGGTAAAVYDHGARFLQAIRPSLEASEIVFEFDTSDIPGQLRTVAIADDGTLALLGFADGEYVALWVVNSAGFRSLVAANRPSWSAFLANSHDAIIADDGDQAIFLVRAVDELAARIPVASFGSGFDSISAVAGSEDGQRIFITSTKSEDVTVVDLQTGISNVIACRCHATGLGRTNARDVFRLNLLSEAPVTLLDASLPEPRVVVIPPAEFAKATASEGQQ